MSLYAEYIKERLNRETIENDNGFMTYEIAGEECYIVDCYVVPSERKSGLGRKMMLDIEAIAKDKKCKWLTGSVKPSAVGSTESVKTLFAVGFKLLTAKEDSIFFVKEL